MRISYSAIRNFLSCRQSYHYSNLLKLEPRAEKPAFFLGHGVHAALENWYLGVCHDPCDWFNEWAAAEILTLRQRGPVDQSSFIDLTVLAHAMIEGYMAHYELTDPALPDNTGVRLLAKEAEFQVGIPGTDGTFIGRVDGICVDDHGSHWIFETKTYSQTPSNHDMNLQTLAYVWAANQPEFAEQILEPLGIPAGTRIIGSLYNGLRKQAPGPRVTKPLFTREWVLRSDDELANFGENILPTIYAEMAQPSVRIYPTLSRECQWCDYKDPCQAKLYGSDEQWVLDTLYIKKPARPQGGEAQ